MSPIDITRSNSAFDGRFRSVNPSMLLCYVGLLIDVIFSSLGAAAIR